VREGKGDLGWKMNTGGVVRLCMVRESEREKREKIIKNIY
jgi:hypothetical protein